MDYMDYYELKEIKSMWINTLDEEMQLYIQLGLKLDFESRLKFAKNKSNMIFVNTIYNKHAFLYDMLILDKYMQKIIKTSFKTYDFVEVYELTKYIYYLNKLKGLSNIFNITKFDFNIENFEYNTIDELFKLFKLAKKFTSDSIELLSEVNSYESINKKSEFNKMELMRFLTKYNDIINWEYISSTYNIEVLESIILNQKLVKYFDFRTFIERFIESSFIINFLSENNSILVRELKLRKFKNSTLEFLLNNDLIQDYNLIVKTQNLTFDFLLKYFVLFDLSDIIKFQKLSKIEMCVLQYKYKKLKG